MSCERPTKLDYIFLSIKDEASMPDGTYYPEPLVDAQDRYIDFLESKLKEKDDELD